MTSNEQRQEYRLATGLIVFIELACADTTSTSTIVVGKSLDISANGLRVIVDRELACGSILRTGILHTGQQLPHREEQFILATEVKWAEPYGNANEYLVGLSLFESEGTHIQQWKEFIAKSCDNIDAINTIFQGI